MTKSARWGGAAVHSPSIPTVASLARNARRIDRRRRGATAVLSAMRRGAALHLSFSRGGRTWILSDGTRVSDEVAILVLADVNVIGCGDSLFRAASAQTYRFIET